MALLNLNYPILCLYKAWAKKLKGRISLFFSSSVKLYSACTQKVKSCQVKQMGLCIPSCTNFTWQGHALEHLVSLSSQWKSGVR